MEKDAKGKQQEICFVGFEINVTQKRINQILCRKWSAVD